MRRTDDMMEHNKTRVHLAARAALVALFVSAFVSGATAQGMPSETELKMPSSAQPAAAVAETSPVKTPQETSGGSYGNDPCPAPQEAMSSAPDDLAKVQEEIDRFTLCVQRAQLLERLNESAMKNDAATDAALGIGGLGMMMPGMAGPQGAGQNTLVPLPAAAFEDIDVGIDEGVVAATPAAAPEMVVKPAAPRDWTINEIYGSGSQIQALLISPEGDEVRTKSGAKLPDGTRVVSISLTGVTVSSGKKARDLQWARQ